MENLLTTSQAKTEPKFDSRGDVPVLITETVRKEQYSLHLNSAVDVLHALKSEPNVFELGKILQWLTSSPGRQDGFDVKKPSPMAAQIIYVLVNEVVPNYWVSLSGDVNSTPSNEKRMLSQCLSSVAGLGALTSRIQQMMLPFKEPQDRMTIVNRSNETQRLEEIVEVIENVLDGDAFVVNVLKNINMHKSRFSHKSLQWKEFLSLVASGKLLSLTGEAISILNNLASSIETGSWIGDGNQYANWLGRNIQYMVEKVSVDEVDYLETVLQIYKKSLMLGYTDQIVRASFSKLMSGDSHLLKKYETILQGLTLHEQKILLYAMIRQQSARLLSRQGRTLDSNANSNDKAVGGIAALLSSLLEAVSSIEDLLIDWLVGTSAEATGQSHTVHRAVIASLSSNTELVKRALQKALGLFGDKLYIKHTPILHQEVNAQITLILAGYAGRVDKSFLIGLSKSSIYLNAVSNRLAGSSERSRFLGMVVGNAILELTNSSDTKPIFRSEDMNSSEAQWYKGLTSVNDAIWSINDLKSSLDPLNKTLMRKTKSKVAEEKFKPGRSSMKSSSKIISIEEVDSSSESEVDGLPTYEKPDSDPSDEDEDPTLIQRDRPTAPVYIRDLIAGLRDSENFDRHTLALSTASSLIRRKSSFGTEVRDSIEDIASLLVGLSDKWEFPDFQKLRLQGMVAVLIAEPLKMGQWFSTTFYNGDYSMGQRASVLTTLGLGARELAGLAKEDVSLTGAVPAETLFPSKRLPDKLHKLYAIEAAPMDAISQQLERTMIQPMAAEAADKATGPNALKVRTFSSRMAVEKKRKKPIPNALAKIVAEGFFFPLTGRWRTHIQSFGESTSHTSPFLLSHLLKTLSLILHASGSSTLSLPLMTSEFWDLLLSLRPRATDPAILEAILFAFLTLLDINENNQRRLAEEHAKELLETQGWVEAVFERIGGGSSEGDRIRMLAAGVLMRTRECVEKHQRLLMGDLMDYV